MPTTNGLVVVTAPTGKIGRQVVDHLLDAAVPVRVVVRDPARLPPHVRERVDVVEGSHRDAAVVDTAFADAAAVFWLMPADRQAPDAVAAYRDTSRAGADAVRAHGITHVVGISALGRGTPVAGHAGNVTGSLAMDDLFATVTNYRAVANPTFMDNVLREVDAIVTDGTVSGPLPPDRAAPLVATRDIAQVASRWLLDRTWTGSGEVPVLGPEDVSGDEMAATVSEVLGVPVRYRQVSPDSLRDAMAAFGASPGMAQAMADMATAKIHGLDDGVARTADTTTPTTFRQWCRDTLAPAVASFRATR